MWKNYKSGGNYKMRCKICKKYFRNARMQMKKDQMCYDCKYEKNKILKIDDDVSAKDLNISIDQAKFLVSSGNKILNDAEMTLGTKFYVRDNWGSPDHFMTLCFSDKPNQISLIIHFLEIKGRLKKVPTKEDMKNESKFSIEEFREKFGSWSSFLNLLGEDPWYRDQKKEKTYYKKPKSYEEQLLEVKEKRIATKQVIEIEKNEIEKEIKLLEKKLIKNEEEVILGLETVINILEMALKDNVEALEKFKNLEKFTDLLSIKKISELKHSIR
jgi:hypothetical protein